MDPLTALSVAGNIVQFIEFGSKLLSTARELYRSRQGTLAADHELHLVTSDLRALVLKLRSDASTPQSSGLQLDAEEKSAVFRKVCDEAIALAEEILERLDGLKVTGKHRVWKSFQQAIRAAWSQRETDNLVQRLSTLKEALETRVLLSLRSQIDLLSLQISDRFTKLDQQTKSIVAALLGDQHDCTGDIPGKIRDQTRAVTQLMSRLSDGTNERHHERSLGGQLLSEGIRSEAYNPCIEMLGVSVGEERILRKTVERSILASLAYEGMAWRFEDVSEAHEETFEWVFHDNIERFFYANFAGWLESGSGIYWVNGKAGSGKSTLMKFIWEHPKTKARLERWANQVPLIMSNFFFWNSGSMEQKSQRGLLQSILLDIFDRCPELIPVALPLDWAKTYSSCLEDKIGEAPKISWPPRKLLNAFKDVVVHLRDRFKFCLFIDGLDEYEGDHEELGRLFKAMSCSSHVKFCISSRPWVVFQDLFKDLPTLRLQDLTEGDIKRFVEAKLRSRYEFEILAARDPTPASTLIETIVQRADGVFLWVELVVRSLVQGLRNRDTLSDLQRRLLIFPKELEPLYEHILNLIEPFYKGWASRTFQIWRASQNHLSSMPSTSEYSPPLTTLALYLAINEDVDVKQLVGRNGGFDHILEKCRDTDTQVTARCAGLLEIKEDTRGRCHQYTLTGLPPQSINWLHRTARDYIEDSSRWSAMVELTADLNFNPNASMLTSCIQMLKIERMEAKPLLECSQDKDDMIENSTFLSKYALIYAHNAELDGHRSYVSIVDQLSNILSTPFKGGHDPYRQYSSEWHDYVNQSGIVPSDLQVMGFRGPSVVRDSVGHYPRIDITGFLPLAVTYGLVSYVRAKLSPMKSNLSLNLSYASLLYFVPTPSLEWALQQPVYPLPRPEMVEMLLQYGADPNANYYFAPSAWERAIEYFQRVGNEVPECCEYTDILDVMIRHGADLHVQLGFELSSGGRGLQHGLRYTPVDVLEMISEVWWYSFQEETPEGINNIIRKLRKHMGPGEDRERVDERAWKRQRHNLDNFSRQRGWDVYR